MTDGTECRPYSSSVCVKGKCVRTGCDGIIGSKLQYDKCGVCGGDSTGCIRVVGNFTKKRYKNDSVKWPDVEKREESFYKFKSFLDTYKTKSATYLLSVLSTVRGTLMW